MPARTIDNCKLNKGKNPDSQYGKCYGFQESEHNDEPCEECSKCKLWDGYEPED